MEAPGPTDALSRIRTRLRGLIDAAIRKHLYQTAIFFADKLVSASRGETEDVYTLADCYYYNAEFRRVIHVGVKFPQALQNSARLRLLNAQALFACEQWEDCLRFLEDHCGSGSVEDPRDLAPFCVLQGQIFEVHENQETALSWYRKAVTYDSYCYEALSRLVGTFLLPQDEEVALVNSLKLDPEDSWLRCFLLGREAAVTLPEKRLKQKQPPPQTDILSRPYCLVDNPAWDSVRSTRLFYEGEYEECYRLSRKVLDGDPFYFPVLSTHIAALVMLERKNDVSYMAHKLLLAYPDSAVAMFAAGCYYSMVAKYEMARRFFHKATLFGPQFAPAWIAYGHAFALHDESDQALAAYLRASRLFPGTHLPWLFIGMEYLRTNVLQLAEQNLEYGRTFLPDDPLLLNELGVVAYNREEYSQAIELLERAARNTPEKSRHISVAIIQNLGHAFLKGKQYSNALRAFERAQNLNPRSPAALVGVAFSYHRLDDINRAIAYYHRALSLNREQVFASEMLQQALRQAANMPIPVPV
eukprot:GEMP01005233.1.p1 GENE.GEMP01005233.1~~GEMP01005233.1.p1  ORF type:complete len:528 (+),score=98.35 GEMP01005233.1:116-1699(+)